jgi:hypothetical protein
LDQNTLTYLIEHITEELNTKHSRESIVVSGGKDNFMFGASGVEHQIDISIMGEHYVLLADVTAWPSAISKSAILEFYARSMDIGIAEDEKRRMVDIIVVTGRGIHPEVQQLADYWRVALCIQDSLDEVVSVFVQKVAKQLRGY